MEQLARVAETMLWSHQQGVLHRDIKPDNIMVGAYGEVLLIDWGLALQGAYDAHGRWYCAGLDQARTCAGTPLYVAPEQAQGHAALLGPASDVYVLSGVLYRMLTGLAPHQADSGRTALQRAAANDWQDPQSLRSDIPSALLQLLRQGLQTDPGQRPSMAAMAQGLRAWLQRSRLEAQARSALDHALQLWQEARQMPSGRGQYAPLQQSRQYCADALAADPDLTPAQQALDGIRQDTMYAALAADDLGVAAGLQDGVDAPARAAYAAACARRRRRAYLRSGLRLGVAAAAVVVATVAWWWWWQIGQAEYRAQQERQELAAALLQETDHDPVLQRARAWQAAGLVGLQPQVHEAVLKAETALFTQALQLPDFVTARARLAALQELHSDAAAQAQAQEQLQLQEAEAQDQQGRRRESQRRQQRLQSMRDYTASDQPEYWDERISGEIAGWDGDDWAADLRRWLADDAALLRRTAALVFALRPEVDTHAALRPLLTDPAGLVRQAAAQALVLRGDEEALYAHTQDLLDAAQAASDAQDLQALRAVWEQAHVLAPWLALPASPGADPQQQLWLAWLRFDWQGVSAQLHSGGGAVAGIACNAQHLGGGAWPGSLPCWGSSG